MRLILTGLAILLFARCTTNYYICAVDNPVVLYRTQKLDTSSRICRIPINKQIVAYKNGKKTRKVIYGTATGYIKANNFYYETPCSSKDLSYLTFNDDSTYSYKGSKITPFPDGSPTYSNNSSSPSSSTGGTVHVKGYYRKNGTYVKPHTRSAPKRKG